MKTARVEDDEFQDQLKKVAENCVTRIKFKRKNPRPIVGMSLLKDFSNTVAMDLKQYGQKYILNIIDLAKRYSNAVLINSRHKDVVVENIIRMWVNTFGVPDKMLTDDGGEFNNEELHDMSENLNTEVLAKAAESPWSNGICERHNAVIGYMIDKIKD